MVAVKEKCEGGHKHRTALTLIVKDNMLLIPQPPEVTLKQSFNKWSNSTDAQVNLCSKLLCYCRA